MPPVRKSVTDPQHYHRRKLLQLLQEKNIALEQVNSLDNISYLQDRSNINILYVNFLIFILK